MSSITESFFQVFKPYLLFFILLALVSMILKSILSSKNKKQNTDISDFPYVMRRLFSDTELKFYNCLKDIIPNDILLFSKVRIWDFIDTNANSNTITYTNKIKAKHVDFLLTDLIGTPIAVIELDDNSHSREERQQRDAFLNNALQAANIPIIRIKPSNNYNMDSIRRSITDLIK